MDNRQRFEQVLPEIPASIRHALEFIAPPVRERAEEIRLRCGLPVTLTVGGEPLFVLKSGQTSNFLTPDVLTAEKREIDECFRMMCRSSLYAHIDEIRQGYITLRCGHRAGVCGTITEGGGVKDITSINIRIAREIFGAADKIIARGLKGGFLIAGPPGSGKTTVLRDLIRQLSNGADGKYRRVTVIDSRGELSGAFGGEQANDLGKNTDVLMLHDKAAGIEIAVRTMFPDIVAFDEIGTAAELARVSDSFNAGVKVITTAHIGDVRDLLFRSVTRQLLESGAISDIAVLSRGHDGRMCFFDAKELLNAAVD